VNAFPSSVSIDCRLIVREFLGVEFFHYGFGCPGRCQKVLNFQARIVMARPEGEE